MGVIEKELLLGQVADQKMVGGLAFPEVLVPSDPSQDVDAKAVAASVKQNKDFIQQILHKNGGILFRGFGLRTAADFNDFVDAFGYEELPYVGGAAPRTNVVGRVFTSNESPPDQKIPFHHEMAQVRFRFVFDSKVPLGMCQYLGRGFFIHLISTCYSCNVKNQ